MLLASPAAEQQRHLEHLGTSPNADELALELDDFVGRLPEAIDAGILSEQQAAAIRRVSDFTKSWSGAENAWLWRVDQLNSASQWREVRRLAAIALQTLDESQAK